MRGINADRQDISGMKRSGWRTYLVAVLIGLGLGVLPHLLGLLLGMANFLITPVLLPFLAVVSGWWLGRWVSVAVASASAGLAYLGGTLIQLAILAGLNGSWLQTIAIPDAIYLTLQASAFAAAFTALGCLLSRLKRDRQAA